MNNNFIKCLSFTLKFEGGYTNNPKDPGGPTNMGVTQKEYNIYRQSKNLLIQSVKLISMGEVNDIYENSYWNQCDCNNLSSGIDFAVFDLSVNNGVKRAKTFLSIALKLFPNGPSSDIIDSICNQRLSFDKSLGELWNTFGHGWTIRIENVRVQSKQLIENIAEKENNV